MSTYSGIPAAPDGDTHLALGLAESAACDPVNSGWERWIDAVEDLLDHDVDGDQAKDGYSIDAFAILWEAGRTPAQAVVEVKDVVL